MLRVLVVDDSPVARRLLTAILNGESDIEVVGEAVNGAEAVDMVPRLTPDVITMDVRMPGLDGYAATREIMISHPTPIVVVSGSNGKDDVEKSMLALDAGALTVIGKPPSPASADFERAVRLFLGTIRSMAAVKVIRRHRLRPAQSEATANSQPLLPNSPPRLIAIAASTGGPHALLTLLSQLPEAFPLPVIIVQHISEGFMEGFVEWLQRSISLPLRIATHQELLTPGTVYIAPEGFHCSVTGDCRIVLEDRPAIGGFRPSATVLFESASRAFGESLIAVMLTGMGNDGVDGLRSVRQMRGIIIGQDEATCVVYGMPKAAADAGLLDKALPLEKISEELEQMTRQAFPKT